MPEGPKIRILREAGGIGDVVRTLPVMAGLKQKYPNCEIFYFGMGYYRDIVEHGNCTDHFVNVSWDERRPRDAEVCHHKYPYLLRAGNHFDTTVDLFCPAYEHEVKTDGACVKDRIDLFCEAAEVEPSLPDYAVTRSESYYVEGWLNAFGIEGREKLVGIQPFSTSTPRNWPEDNWHALIHDLHRLGFQCVIFDGHSGRSGRFGGMKFCGHRMWKLAAMIDRCDYMVTPDSGLFHLAAAVGTPTLGLFGSTNGYLMLKHYPLHDAIIPMKSATDGTSTNGTSSGPPQPDVRLRCKPPCYMRHSRGYTPECRNGDGCAVLKSIAVEKVVSRVRENMRLTR